MTEGPRFPAGQSTTLLHSMHLHSVSFMPLLLAFGATALIAGLLVHTRDWHLHLTGDHPESPPVDYSSWGSWLPEPECEKKYVAYRRIQREGMVREVMFEEAKKFYRHALTKMRGQKLFEGSLSDVAFYLALRHFPPQ